jgi:hypothetical protein
MPEEKSAEKPAGSQSVDWLSPWIGRAGSLAVALTVWLGAFNVKDEVKPYAYVGAALVTAGYAIWLAWRRRHMPPAKVAAAPAPIETSVLRSFLPFEDGDTLIGRRSDVADAIVILQSTGFRFGVVWGESGCGKTSFLRAGLVPELRRRGHVPIYIPRPTENPAGEIEQAISRVEGDARVIVIIDQFEEYFLTHASRGQSGALGAQLRALLEARPRCSLVIAIRRDLFARLQSLAPEIADPTSPRTTFELGNLRTEAAREVLNQAAAQDAVGFESALIDAVIEDLEADSQVWPVDLQLIGTRLKRARIRQKTVYAALGRRRGVVGGFIRDEVARLPKPVLGEIVLRKLCAPGGITKSPVDITLDAIIEDVRARDPALLGGTELTSCLEKLKDARIIIQTGDDTFNLSHDALAPLIQHGTKGLQGRTEAADRIIAFYLADFREDRTVRIPLRDLPRVRRYATPQTLTEPQVRLLIRKSWRSAAFSMTWPASAVMLAFGAVGYGMAFATWSIGTSPSNTAHGRPAIVVRSGNPFVRFLPGVDRVIEGTGLIVDALDSGNAVAVEQVSRGDLWGRAGPVPAVERIASSINPLSRIFFVRLAGLPEAASSAYETLAKSSDTSNTTMLLAANSLGLTGRADAADLREPLVQALVQPADAPRTKRLAGSLALLWMVDVQPRLRARVPLNFAQATAILKEQIVSSKSSNPSWETPLVEAVLARLALDGPVAPSESDGTALMAILDDTSNDPWARARDHQMLEFYAAANESLAGPALAFLLNIGNKSTLGKGGWEAAGAVRVLPRIARSRPAALRQPEVVAALASFPGAPWNDAAIQAMAIPFSLLGRVDPAALPAWFAPMLAARLEDVTTVGRTRMVASIAWAHLRAGNPRLNDAAGATARVIDLLRDTKSPGSKEADQSSLRRAAVSAVADLAASGQLDAVSTQIAVHSLAGILEQQDSAGEDSWEENGLDIHLAQLVDGGAAVDAATVTQISAAIRKHVFSGDQYEAADLLIVAARTAPREVLRHQAELDALAYVTGFAERFDGALRQRILAALGRADAASAGGPDRSEPCWRQLAMHDNSDAWQRGAYCAYFIALDDAAALAPMQTRLRSGLAGGVAERLAARTALEMLATAQRVHEARAKPALAALVRAKMRLEQNDAEPHICIAARAGLLSLH